MGSIDNDMSEGQALWWKVCRPAIAGLLDSAGTYTAEEKENQLSFFKRHVAPWLGPQPLSDGTQAVNPIDAISPLECSLNFTDKGKPMVRYQYEPLSATRERQEVGQRFGQSDVRDMLSRIQPEMADLDLTWAEQFVTALFPSSDAEDALALQRAKTELPPPLDHALTFNMAVDLSGSRRKMKAYLFPMAKNLATGLHRDALDLGFGTLRSLKPHGDQLAPALDFLERYWGSCPDRLTLDMIGMDCIDPAKARIKIYAHTATRNSWNVVRHVCTFGGLSTDPDRLKGLEVLHSIWDNLRNDEGNGHDDDYDKPMRHPTSFLGSLMFSFEIVSGRAAPEVKVYIPMWQYAPSDGHVAANLLSAFQKLGWDDVAAMDKIGVLTGEKNYMSNLRKTFPGADLDSPSSVLHSNLSFSYSSKTGAYMSVYYAVSGKATLVAS